MTERGLQVLNKVKRFVQDNDLLVRGQSLVAAISGGADSMVMLHILLRLAEELDLKVHVVHVNHQLRGAESDEDASVVMRICEKWNVPFREAVVNVKKEADLCRESVQVAARRLRYDALVNEARRVGADIVCTAHHADDQAETVLMRIIRGTSLHGLRGIPATGEWSGIRIVRPLHSLWRYDIEKYAEQEEVLYRTDSSNLLTKYFRNKVRLDALPYLERKYNENVKDHLYKLASLAEAEDSYLAMEARRAFEKVVLERSKEAVTVAVESFRELHVALQRRVITLILYCLMGHISQWEYSHVEAVRRLALGDAPGAAIDLPCGAHAYRQYQTLHIVCHSLVPDPQKDGLRNQAVQLVVPGETLVREFGISIRAIAYPYSMEQPVRSEDILSSGSNETHRLVELFDFDAVAGRVLVIRGRFPGDVMRPWGLTGTKKVKKLLMEAHVPTGYRDRWPMLVIDDQIEWVIGIRRGSSFPVTQETRRVLQISVKTLDTSHPLTSLRG